MTDPVDITTQATQVIADSSPATHAGWAILGGVVLKVIEAIAKLFDYRAPARFVEMVEWAEAVAQHRGRLVSFSWVEATGLTRSEAVKLDRRSVQLGQLPKTPETASAGS